MSGVRNWSRLPHQPQGKWDLPALKGTVSPGIYFSCRLPPGWSQELQQPSWGSAQGPGWLPRELRPTLGLASPELVAMPAQSPPTAAYEGLTIGNILGCLNLGTVDIWGWTLLHCGAALYIIKHFSNIPGLHPPSCPSPKLWQPKISAEFAKRTTGRALILQTRKLRRRKFQCPRPPSQ